MQPENRKSNEACVEDAEIDEVVYPFVHGGLACDLGHVDLVLLFLRPLLSASQRLFVLYDGMLDQRLELVATEAELVVELLDASVAARCLHAALRNAEEWPCEGSHRGYGDFHDGNWHLTEREKA